TCSSLLSPASLPICPVDADGEDILHRFEIGIAAVMKQEGPIAANPGRNHLPGFGMKPDIARQREQRQRLFEIDAARRPAFRQARDRKSTRLNSSQVK